jgi:CDP-diacylglycerol pyrophosphatase
MKMKPRIILISVIALVAVVTVACTASEIVWSTKANNPDALRQTVGLPSIAIGNLNPAARNPGLEVLCTGLYDAPGGYCFYFTNGVPYINFTITTVTAETP